MDVLLKDFIHRLESLPDKVPIDILKTHIIEMDIQKLPIEAYTNFSGSGYKRNIVYVSNKCEVTVICYKNGQVTPIHDHGNSVGITIVREGTMTEELFLKQPTGTISPMYTRRYYSNWLACVNSSTIHRVSNVHADGLVTFNVYFPPLLLMNIYHLENNRTEKWIADYPHMEMPVIF